MLSMELQLGLALPIHSPMAKGFDLNLLRFESEDNWDQISKCERKRGFEEAFGKNIICERYNNSSPPRKFMAELLVWHGQPNDHGDDDRKGHKNLDSSAVNKYEGDEENYIIGWPPIKSSRKKELLHSHGNWRARYGNGNVNVHAAADQIRTRSTAQMKANGSSSSPSNNSMYVKVKMEGVAIARKVDLSLHRSYHTLKHSLLSMFSNYDLEGIEDGKRYTLTYQDKEGDWLLAGDVPWKSFIKSVQRLEIVRN